jgi:hypothetical protein
MSDSIQIIKPLTVAVSYATPNDVDEAKYVQCCNTNKDSIRFIAIRDASGNIKNTTAIGGHQSLLIEKDRTDKISGSSGVGGTIVANALVSFTKVSINGQA